MRKTCNLTYVSHKKVGWYVVIRKISRFMVRLEKFQTVWEAFVANINMKD